MTDDELREIKQRWANGSSFLSPFQAYVAARKDIPALLAEVEMLRQLHAAADDDIDQLDALLREAKTDMDRQARVIRRLKLTLVSRMTEIGVLCGQIRGLSEELDDYTKD